MTFSQLRWSILFLNMPTPQLTGFEIYGLAKKKGNSTHFGAKGRILGNKKQRCGVMLLPQDLRHAHRRSPQLPQNRGSRRISTK